MAGLQRAWKAGNSSDPRSLNGITWGRNCRSRKQYEDRLKAERRYEDLRVARMAAKLKREPANRDRFNKAVAKREKPGLVARVKRFLQRSVGKA